MAGITETQDVIKAVGIVAAAARKAISDGIDFDDIDTMTSPEIKEAVKNAVDGITEVPGEVTDIDLGEIMQLFGTVSGAVRNIL